MLKKTTLIAFIAAFLMFIGFSTTAFAQETQDSTVIDQPVDQPADNPVSADQPADQPVDQSMDQPAEPTFDDFTMSLTNYSTELSDLESAGEFTANDVRVVDVNSLVEEGDETLNTTLQDNDASVQEIRTKIAENAILNEALMNNGLTNQDVVGLDVSDDGQVTIYHN